MASFITCLNLFITCLLLHALFTVAHVHEVAHQSEFTYDLSETGPHNWGKLNPNWTACGIGKLQSPIDLGNHRVVELPELGNLIRVHKPAPAALKNRGHDITVEWEGDAGGVIINGTLYKLQQCHWHTPSEHTVNARRYNMEMHMVHQDSHGQIAVVSILYKPGRADPFLASLLENNTIANVTAPGIVDPREITFGSKKYLRYIGSLTTPPCTEGVIWTILEKVMTVSASQLRALRNAVHDGFENNSRPIQHFENPVYMYPDNTPLS